MTTIDHRILIPAAPDAVWEYISDITRNPDWQIDCAEVIFLTTRREGPGLRWRSAAPTGHHETVIAVTAWYNGLGYEYYFVDGVPYRENRGRIRLQEIPEGTIVQWTFTYELGGVFGGMRNTLGIRRQIDHTIAESLKTLWQKLKQTGPMAQAREAKSLMRDAPDVQARSAYQSRHAPPADSDKTRRFAEPAKLVKEPPIREGDGQPIRVIAEPPIREDDTRPRPAFEPPPVPAAAEIVPVDLDEGEPEFLSQLPNDLARFEPPPTSRREPEFLKPVADIKRFEPPADVDEAEPEFLSQLPNDLARFEPPVDPSDTQPRKPIVPLDIAPTQNIQPLAIVTGEETEPLAVPLPEKLPDYSTFILPTKPEPEQQTAPVTPHEEETALDVEAAVDEPVIETQPTAPPATEPSTPPVVVSVPPTVETEAEAPQVVELPVPEPEASYVVEPPAPEPVVAQKPTQDKPTAPEPTQIEPKPAVEHASIWEIFGVPRPSETQEAAASSLETTKVEAMPPSAQAATSTNEPAAVTDEPAPVAEAVTVTPPERAELPPASSRVGLRSAMRRTLVRVRRP